MKKLIPVAMLLTLAACGGGQKAPDIYTLAPHTAEGLSCSKGSSIKIYEPSVAPGLDNPRIAVRNTPTQLTFYKGVRWNAQAGRVVQHFLADSFERSGMFSTVTTDEASNRTRWILETQLRDLVVDQSQGGRIAHVRLTATVIDSVTRNTVLTLPLESQEDVTGMKLAGIVESFSRQLGSMSHEIQSELRRRVGCR